MTYPQSGGYGYGQDPQGAQNQQYGQQGYDAAQGQYGQAAQYGQQAQDPYGQQAQYGYGAPQQPVPAPSQGLPANTPVIVAAVIGALGVITLFCGFLAGYSFDGGEYSSRDSVKIFETSFGVPWALLAVAGLVALTTFALGVEKWVVGSVLALTVVSAFGTVFIFAGADAGSASNGAGAIVLLITSILSAIAAVVWLLIEGGQIKLAPADAAAAAGSVGYAAPAADQYTAAPQTADPYAAQQQAAAQQAQQPAAGYGYGYGQQGQAAASQQPEAQGYTPATQAISTNQQPAGGYGQPAGDVNATTAFVKPNTDPGAASPQSEQQ
ncbi:DUF5336 domain-containing protein [Gordonia sp. PDNC005]|uniref:DUF5336 domain-containing protein n=1 Tax=unclassified Gordonia (in: high G+C Gram-positive bacteria) TaxID=2657482 RepID=UPI001965EBDD|nr:DUF5336 domain-containing protein [Gordonia sp. PDNC005]QRY63115.1 DUF5336 domain-containing protein [Gordonia sp. PDNC005]